MLKDSVNRFFGLQRKIKNLRSQVKELSWDEPFGMLTRGAFLQHCRVMPRGRRVVAFIDLDEIHSLNRDLGYTEVDKRVKATFSIRFRRSDLVARWYSGDEIVILFDCDMDGAEVKISQIRESARKNGLTFTYEIGEWAVGHQSIINVIDDLSNKNCKKDKTFRR